MTISFHLPPIAASAAVSGQSLTGFGRRAGGMVTARFLLADPTSVYYDAAVTRLLLCSVVLALQAAQGAALHDGQRDFDFEIGAWKARLSRLDQPLTGSTTWLEYEGTSTVRKIWNGRANLGELDVAGPAGRIEGLSLRLYDARARQWNITWANARSGVLDRATMFGGFTDGRGEFFGQDSLDGRAIFVRFVFSSITPASFRFEQAFSADGGKTWEVNWKAAFTR